MLPGGQSRFAESHDPEVRRADENRINLRVVNDGILILGDRVATITHVHRIEDSHDGALAALLDRMRARFAHFSEADDAAAELRMADSGWQMADAESDAGYQSLTRVHLTAGYFGVFFPEDGHRPKINDGIHKGVLKAVVKIHRALLDEG